MAHDRTPGVKPEPLVISRVFAAPRALVYEAWSTAEHMRRWFCPAGFTVPQATIDFRVGGVCDICMRSPDGKDFWSKGHYLEILPPERLVFTADVVGDDDVARFTALTTVRFEDAQGGTRLTVHQAYEVLDATAMDAVRGAPEGWRTTLDHLDQEVAGLQRAAPVVHGRFTLERSYDAPAARVFQALVDPAAKARWFGGGEGHTVLDRRMDARPGGREHVSGRWTSGVVSTFDATYHDVVPDRRLIYSYEMRLDDRKISVSLATMELHADGARTRLVVTEQGVFLGGYPDDGSRERGTAFLLERLGTSLEDLQK